MFIDRSSLFRIGTEHLDFLRPVEHSKILFYPSPGRMVLVERRYPEAEPPAEVAFHAADRVLYHVVRLFFGPCPLSLGDKQVLPGLNGQKIRVYMLYKFAGLGAVGAFQAFQLNPEVLKEPLVIQQLVQVITVEQFFNHLVPVPDLSAIWFIELKRRHMSFAVMSFGFPTLVITFGNAYPGHHVPYGIQKLRFDKVHIGGAKIYPVRRRGGPVVFLRKGPGFDRSAQAFRTVTKVFPVRSKPARCILELILHGPYGFLNPFFLGHLVYLGYPVLRFLEERLGVIVRHVHPQHLGGIPDDQVHLLHFGTAVILVRPAEYLLYLAFISLDEMALYCSKQAFRLFFDPFVRGFDDYTLELQPELLKLVQVPGIPGHLAAYVR